MANNKKQKAKQASETKVENTTAVEIVEPQAELETTVPAAPAEAEVKETKLDNLKNVLAKQKQPEADKQKQIYTAMAGIKVVRS